MNFDVAIEKLFGDGFFANASFAEIVICLFFSLIIGILIYVTYRIKNKSDIYSRDFNIVLMLLPVITCALVLSMQSNIGLSLGMVGALSIVRFRNAVKSSLDLLFLFWAISIGIICGGELFLLGTLLSLILSIVLLISDILPKTKETSLLIINSNNINNETKIMKVISKYVKYYKIKSKSIHGSCMDLIIEVRGKKVNEILNECSKIKDVENINLLSHDGDIRL